MRVIFTPLAERHVDDLYAYISSASNAQRAEAFTGRIITFCIGLSDFPLRGVARNDLLLNLRVIGFERRVTIAFVVGDDIILIQGVFYGGRDFETDLLQ